MQLPTLQSAKLIRRYKRFLTDIELPNGEVITIHCANTGAMTGCGEKGDTVILILIVKRANIHTVGN